MKNLPFGFWYRISAASIDLAIWFVVIGILDYIWPGMGFLVGFVILSFILSYIDKLLSGKTIGQTVLGLESKKVEVILDKSLLDKLLRLIAWLIPFAYLIQPFWVKTMPNENAWYDKTLRRKIEVPNRVRISRLAYPVLISLILTTAIAIASYFVLLPF